MGEWGTDGGGAREGRRGSAGRTVLPAVFRTGHRRGPTASAGNPLSEGGRRDGRGVRGRMDLRLFTAEPLGCSPGTVAALLSGYTPIQNKKPKKKKEKENKE